MCTKARRRNYSQKTLKVLFARSGDQCAIRDCQSPIIQPEGENYDETVLGQICHIYARNPTGPRGDGGLSDEELDAESNLILLCPNHHQIVDKTPKQYTPEVLKAIKSDHTKRVRHRMMKPSELPEARYASFPTAIIDKAINHELDILRRCQFYPEFDVNGRYFSLGERIIEGEFSSGSDEAKAIGLSYCARYASIHAARIDSANHYLQEARRLSHGPWLAIAESYLFSRSDPTIDLLKSLVEDRAATTLSATFYLLKMRSGVDTALKWITESGITPSDLDAVGKVVLLMSYFDTEDWNAASNTLDHIDESDLDSIPILNHFVGLVNLLSAVPEELKSLVLVGVPLNAASFPIAADESSTISLQRAVNYFDSAAASAEKLECISSARSSSQYAIWIRLVIPATREKVREELRERFTSGSVPLHLLNLALEFGVEIRTTDVEQELERTIALTGVVSLEATIARFSLATMRDSPDEFADYIDLHFETLSTHLQPKFLRFNQISVLAIHGRRRRASECLDALLNSGIEISESEESYLRNLIKFQTNRDSIEVWLQQFQESNSIGDLRLVVNTLQTNQSWEELCSYSKLLFARTRSKEDAEIVAQALRNCNKSTELKEFLDTNSFIVSESWNLKLLLCWCLVDHGNLHEARTKFLELERRDADPNYRELEVMTNVLTGHWESLLPFVENQLRSASSRAPHELLRAASLAEQLGSPYAKELVVAAAESGKDNPEILAAAFQLATHGGWEDDHRAGEWINAARRLSDSKGPVLSFAWDELVSQVPKWHQQRVHIKNLVEQAEVPIIAAAESLSRPLSDFILAPAFANLSESQPRRLLPIPIYSGSQIPTVVSLKSTIGFDLTSLLVLEFLGLLQIAFSSIDSISLPSGILEVLLWERSLSRFHQPSHVKHGRHLQSLVLANRLNVLAPSSTPDSDLADEVGDELAILLAEAERTQSGHPGERVVVRSAPVYRVTSGDRAVVDLTSHSAVMVSCCAVVRALKERGQLTEEEFEQSQAYLNAQEEPWPNQPSILDSAELFLDSLSVSYFLYLGLIERICTAGFRVFVSSDLMSRFSALTTQEDVLSRVRASLDNIRREIVHGIESGKISVSPSISYNTWDDEPKALQMVESLFVMAKDSDVLVCDDRFFNQRECFSDDGTDTRIVSTISLIDSLLEESRIGKSLKHSSLTKLRRAGFLFVPVGLSEMTSYLPGMRLVSGRLSNVAELSAIRNSLILARISSVFNAENELRWLDRIVEVMIRAIRAEWVNGGMASDLRCRSDWISKQIDLRGWAHKLGPSRAIEVARLNYLGFIPILFTKPAALAAELVPAYWRWIEETILSEVKLRSAHSYQALVEQHRAQIDVIVRGQLEQLRDRFGDSTELMTEIARIALEYSPPLIRQSLLTDQEYLTAYGSGVYQVMQFQGGRVEVRRDQLFDAVRESLLGKKTVHVGDLEGNTWSLSTYSEDGSELAFQMSSDRGNIRLPNLYSLAPDRDARMSGFRHASDQMRIPSELREKWLIRLEPGPLKDGEVIELLDEFKDSPVYVAATIASEFKKNQIEFNTLIPSSVRYYECLVGVYHDESNIREYASGSAKDFLSDVTKTRTKTALMEALLVSGHSELTKHIPLGDFDLEILEDVFSDLATSGDPLSRIGALEAGLRIIHERPELTIYMEGIIASLRDDTVERENVGYGLQASLFVLTDSELSRRRVLTGHPPFYRRLAALAHSSVLFRLIAHGGVDVAAFCDYIDSHLGPRFYLQSFVDMRLEPRWEPTFCAPIYFRTEFLSRLLSVSLAERESIMPTPLYSILLGETSESVQSQSEFPAWYFAGPLEGVLGLTSDLANDLVRVVREQMDSVSVTPKSFIALINAAFLGSVESQQADLASDTLLRGRYRFGEVENKGELMSALYGLARVSAYARSSRLAEALRMVCRNYRNDREFGLSVDEELRIILMAGSSLEDRDSWCNYVGEWMVEASSIDFGGDQDRAYLYWSLEMLSEMVPELWVWCGSAHAALSGEYESA